MFRDRKLMIFGAGGHGISVANVALSMGYQKITFVDDQYAGQSHWGFPIVTEDHCFSHSTDAAFSVAVGDNNTRKLIVDRITALFSSAMLPPLIHCNSSIGYQSKIGLGTVVMANVNVGPNSIIGNYCILNSNSSVDHDCILGDFVSIAPGAILGGSVTIGNMSAIGIGATLKHKIAIGKNTVIGAASYVSENIDCNKVAFGVPCKEMRSRHPTDKYL